MPAHSYSRISITLPPEVLAAADRLARQLDRPRSWVFAEAVRRLASAEIATPAPPAGPSAGGQERSVLVPESPSLEAGQLAELQADLELSVEERVHAAEERARAAPQESRRPGDQILFFNRFEEYLRWDERSRGVP